MSGRDSNRHVIPEGDNINGYIVTKLVGVGGFGEIYAIKDNNSHIYAMKSESVDSPKRTLLTETKIFKELKGGYFPKYIDSGTNKKYNIDYLIMSYLGASIGEIQVYHDYKIEIEAAYNICLKMLEAIKAFHSCGFVHRDIKPNNFLIQKSKHFPIVLIDFNLSARHIDPDTNKPFPCENEQQFIGTRKYASIDVLNLLSYGRKDDLISWFYSFLDIACGSLPWESEKDSKKAISMRELFQLSDLSYKFPKKFQEIYDYLKSLKYSDKPDYDHIKKLFKEGMEDDLFDPTQFNWSDFVSKHSNMTKFEEKMGLMTLKFINDKNNKQKKKKHIETKEVEKNEKNHSKKHGKKGKKDCLIQ